MNGKITVVIGVTESPTRYANMAVRKLREYGHAVIAMGVREGQVLDVPIVTEYPKEEVDTVTIYVNPKRQEAIMDEIIHLHPRRVIFNPETENPAFYQRLEKEGIEVVEACTLVMLSTHQY